MGTQLAIIEPIPLPDVRRPAKCMQLPPWLMQRCSALGKASQPDRSGNHREVQVLPKSLILGEDQKMLVERHISALETMLSMTPYDDESHGSLTMQTVTKMMLVLPSRESGDLVGQAKGEAYMDALDDVPSWAVQEAMRKWHRAEYGPKHDYKWQPAPSTLRELAMIETYRIMGLRRRLNGVLAAEPLLEFTPEHEASMRAKIDEYLKLRSA
jgi:hypothetical protein